MNNSNLLYIDLGIVVNLWATEHAVEILRAMPYRCAVLDKEEKKPLLLWTTSTSDEEPVVREEVSVTFLVKSGVLEVHQFQSKHYAQSYVSFAQHVSDTKAALLTLAASHSAMLATDDKRTRKVFRHFTPNSEVMSSLNFLQTWQMHLKLSDADLCTIVRFMRERAQFIPPADDPLFPWWKRLTT